MFSTMIEDLLSGNVPALPPLRLRLHAAMVKKTAMLRLAREFHHTDPKINPDTVHMLWAAILLEDSEAMEILVGILITEAHERHAAHRGAMAKQAPPDSDQVVTTSLEALLALATNQGIRQLLCQKISNSPLGRHLPGPGLAGS